jgi:phosphoglycolate phosphatase/AHBA synthesis associated protein
MFAAVLFDLDGVLIDSRDAWYHLLCAAARDLGYRAIQRDVFDACFGQGIEADVERFFPRATTAELEAYFDAHFLEHVRHVLVDPDAAPVMQALAQRGIAHAIVTNTTSALARETVRGAGLEPDLLVGASDVRHGKPAPDMVLLACERLGVPPRQALLVGDSRFDRDAARAAGVRFVGYGMEGDARIDRLPELLHLADLA